MDDPRTAIAYNEFAPITNIVLGTGSLKNYEQLRFRYPKIINDTNNIQQRELTCDGCLSSLNHPDNKLVYCELCLSAVHVNCHGRKLLYASQGSDKTSFDQFICERCKYFVDNNTSDKDYEKVKCKFCDETKGIMIYIDKSAKRAMMIGWAHICCIYWHPFLEFADK